MSALGLASVPVLPPGTVDRSTEQLLGLEVEDLVVAAGTAHLRELRGQCRGSSDRVAVALGLCEALVLDAMNGRPEASLRAGLARVHVLTLSDVEFSALCAGEVGS